MPSIRRTARFRAAVGAVLATSIGAGAASGDTAAAYAELCERAIQHGAAQGRVPLDVLHAIALTESGRWQQGRLRPWPWAINREGQGYWFASRNEALAFARRSLGEGRRSFDIGCFQINHRWHGDRFPSLEAMADPMTGAVYAASFLRELYEEFGSWSAAAGAYHSRTPEFARRYRARFDAILADLDSRLAAGPASAPGADADPVRDAPQPSGRQVRGPLIITIKPMADGEELTPEVQAAGAGRQFVVRPPAAAERPSSL